jgi:hypothetical protein
MVVLGIASRHPHTHDHRGRVVKKTLGFSRPCLDGLVFCRVLVWVAGVMRSESILLAG